MIIESIILGVTAVAIASIKYSFEYIRDEKKINKRVTFHSAIKSICSKLEILKPASTTKSGEYYKCPYCYREFENKMLNTGYSMFCEINKLYDLDFEFDKNIPGTSSGMSVLLGGKYYTYQGCITCRS